MIELAFVLAVTVVYLAVNLVQLDQHIRAVRKDGVKNRLILPFKAIKNTTAVVCVVFLGRALGLSPSATAYILGGAFSVALTAHGAKSWTLWYLGPIGLGAFAFCGFFGTFAIMH